MKMALAEVERLRATFHETLSAYTQRLDAELDAVSKKIGSLTDAEKIPAARLRDLREILTLLRHNQIKSEKGRRKDLKKMDSVVGDLAMLVEDW